jgi:two-component system OmpR family sensor kinase
VALVAAVCTVIGGVTIFALHDFLYGQLDNKVHDTAMRAGGPPAGQNGAGQDGDRRPRSGPGLPGAGDIPFVFLVGGGQPGETVGASVSPAGVVTQAAVSAADSDGGQLVADDLSARQAAAFADVPRDGKPHTLHVPDLGDYRVESARPAADGSTVLVGMSTSGVQDTLSTLIWVEVSVTAAGLVAAGLAGAALMRIALEPLRRVAATATRVSELPLDRGEVALHERVPASFTDPRTEVGQVGAALNRMLGHVGSALHARQESETRVRQFVADASHELRTPLASIRGYAELTRRGTALGSPDAPPDTRPDTSPDTRPDTSPDGSADPAPSPGQDPAYAAGPGTRHALGRIESEAARMTTLVEDLLLLARLDAGRPLSLAETDLSPLVVDAVSDARAAGRGHNWRLDLPDRPATVRGDAQRLHQVLANLLANARAHTPPGTTVTARVTPAGRDVRLQVEDDGPGVPEELRPHVFERFARGDASRSRASGSTGLGLAIVHSVVAAHGGDVTLDSVPGRTVFTVTLPAADEPSAGASAGRRAQPASALPAHPELPAHPHLPTHPSPHSQPSPSLSTSS